MSVFSPSSYAYNCLKNSDRSQINLDQVIIENIDEVHSVIVLDWTRSSCHNDKILKNDFGRIELSHNLNNGKRIEASTKKIELSSLASESNKAYIYIKTKDLRALGSMQIELIAGSFSQSTRATIDLEIEFTDGVGEVYLEKVVSNDI